MAWSFRVLGLEFQVRAWTSVSQGKSFKLVLGVSLKARASRQG